MAEVLSEIHPWYGTRILQNSWQETKQRVRLTMHWQEVMRRVCCIFIDRTAGPARREGESQC